MSEPEIRLGTGVWVYRGDQLLIGRRNSLHGPGTWCPPGGHVEEGESFEDCAAREVMEEASIEIEPLKHLNIVIEDLQEELGALYRTSFFLAAWKAGEPIVLPSEYFEWRWARWEEMPEPLFRPAKFFVEKYGNPLGFL